MPALRSQRLKKEEEKEDKPLQKMKIPNATTQWVMIVPDDLTKINDDGCCFYKMPHPDTESPSLFLFKEKKVYQVMKCDESYRSWFIDETVQKDGSFCMITPVDPLFLALPYLEKFAMENKFSTLDNILIDENYQQALTKLEDCLTKQNLLNICICKGSDDIVAYKSDESKILAWLSLKVSKLSEHLSTSNINVGQGAKVSNFGQVYRDAKLKEEDCNRYAWTVISEYIPNDWVDKLKENMNKRYSSSATSEKTEA